jgi:hypothetical protein
VLFEARRISEYGISVVGIGDPNFWANADITQQLLPDNNGVFGPVDWLDGYPQGDYIGRFISPSLAFTERMDLVFPNGFQQRRGLLWVLSLVLMQGRGKGVVWWHSDVLDLRPPTAANVLVIAKSVLGWLGGHATSAEKALAETTFVACQGVPAEVNGRGAVGGVLDVEAGLAMNIFPDRAAIPQANTDPILAVPGALPRTADRVLECRADLVPLVAAAAAARLNAPGNRAGAAAQRASQALIASTAAAAAAGQALLDIRLRATGVIPGVWGSVHNTRGAATSFARTDMTVDYSLPMLSSLGWLARVTNRLCSRTADGTQMGFDESDSMFLLGYMFFEAGAVYSRRDFWSCCPNARNWLPSGMVDSAEQDGDMWPELITQSLFPQSVLMFGDRPNWSANVGSAMARRPVLPQSWEPAGRLPTYMLPWVVPNLIPIGVIALVLPMSSLRLEVAAFPPTEGYTSGGISGGQWITLISSKIDPGTCIRWQDGIGMEYYSVMTGGRTRPLERAGFVGQPVVLATAMSRHVVPEASHLDCRAFTSVSTWFEMSNPVERVGVVVFAPANANITPNIAPLVSGRRQYTFRS